MNNLDSIIISINGLDQPTYGFHQKGGDLERVLEGLRRLNLVRDKTSALTLQFVVNKGNIGQIVDLEGFAYSHGFDELVIKSFNVIDHDSETFRDYVPYDRELSRYDDGKVKNHPSEGNYPCLSWFVVNYDGSANPCCWDYNGEFVFGNVKTEGVMGLWNNYLTSHRERIRNSDFLKICGDCTINTTIKSIDLT